MKRNPESKTKWVIERVCGSALRASRFGILGTHERQEEAAQLGKQEPRLVLFLQQSSFSLFPLDLCW